MEVQGQAMATETNQSSDRLFPLNEGESDGLVVHCSDPRFQEAFSLFTREVLGIKRPAKIVLPGSSLSFGVQGLLPKRWNAMRSHIELLAKANRFNRVVIINHDDCKAYGELARMVGGLANISSSQTKHILSMASFLKREYLSEAKFDLYQAKIVTGSDVKQVRFERVI